MYIEIICSVHTYLNLSQMYYSYINILPFACSTQHSDERLPDIMWCRDPFMEALNEIEDINYVDYESVNHQT